MWGSGWHGQQHCRGRAKGASQRGRAGPGLLHAHVCGGHAARPDQRGAIRHCAEQQRAQARPRGRAAGRGGVAVAPLLAFSGASPQSSGVRGEARIGAVGGSHRSYITAPACARSACLTESGSSCTGCSMTRTGSGTALAQQTARVREQGKRALSAGALPAKPLTP